MKHIVIIAALAATLAALPAMARGGGGHSSGSHAYSSSSHSVSRGSSSTPGTGSKSSSTSVRGYTKKDGTRVAPYKRSTPDHNFRNNWSTKGNTNPVTGKSGSRLQPPTKH